MMIKKIGLLIGMSFLALTTIFAGADKTAKPIKLSFPDKKWTLQFSPPAFEITENEINGEGLGRRIMGTSKLDEKDAEVIISVFLENAPEKGDSKACRNYYTNRLKKAPFFPDAKEVKTSEKGNIAFFEYIIKEIGGQPINQKNLYAYISNDGVWIDIHMSKVIWEEKDQKIFDAIANTIKIEKLDDSKVIKYSEGFTKQLGAALENYGQKQYDKNKEALLDLAKTTKNVSTIFFWLGNVLYYQSNYPEAIKYYQMMLDMEKINRFLPDMQIRVGIDNLGMAYGISGNLKKSEETLLSGIKDYPFYPHFYYNLSCTYAEGKDTDKALKYLETAFQKAESYTAEKLPEASTDSSFKTLKENPAFGALLKKYNRD